MKRVITAAILVPIVLVLIFQSSFLLILIASALVAELAAWEFLGLSDRMGTRTPRIAVLVAIAVVFAALFRNTEWILPAVGACSLALFIYCSFHSPLARVLPDASASVFAVMYTGLTLTSVPLLWAEEHGASLLVFLFLVVWCGDVAALYAGRAFGRRKLAPAISPKKTWEGSTASLAGSVIVTIVLYYAARRWGANSLAPLSYPGSLAFWVPLAVVLNVAAQTGDLIESAIKRGSGVKDSGTLLPGHGGVLDRIDALLLAAPVLWYARFIQQFF